MPVKTTPIHVPFNAGMREDIDPKLLPDGLFTRLENARYRKDGRLGLRNGYEELSMTTDDGGTLVPYDLASYRDRLVVLGNERGDGFPTNVYEYTGMSGIGWKTPTGDITSHVVHPFTDMRALHVPPQMAGGVLTPMAMATCHGFVMVAYRAANSADTVFIYVIRESDGQVVLSTFDTTTNRNPIVLTTQSASGGRCFIFLGYDSISLRNVRAYRFDPLNDSALVSLGSLENIAADITAIAAAEVAGTNQFVLAVDRSLSNLLVKRFNTSGAQQGSTITLAGTSATYLAIEAATTGAGTINLAQLASATLSLYTWTFAGALTGPTSLTTACSTSTENRPTIARLPANAGAGWGESVAILWGEVPAGGVVAMNTHVNGRNIASHAQTVSIVRGDFALTTQAISLQSPGQPFVLAVGGTVRDTNTLTGAASNALLYMNGIANQYCFVDVLTAVNALGALARDTIDVTTGRLVWGKQVANLNGEGVLSLASLSVQSSARRQIVEVQGDLFFASAQPQTWNGDLLAEIGFGELPGIRSAVASNSTGLLATSASYDYVATWTWYDGQNQIVRSAPSNPVTVATGASDDTVTLVVSVPHQLRGGLGFTAIPTGITVTVWRTVWDGAAKVTGFRKATSTTTLTTNGGTVTIVDLASDAAVLASELLYTDGGTGALSGTIPRLSPEPVTYLAPSDDVVLGAGMIERTQIQQSIPVLSGESVAFCPFAGVGVSFYANCQRPIVGAAVVDGARVFFHDDGISISSGPGPDADGRGSIPAPQLIPTNFGLRDDGWRSLLLTADGLWFQADDDKLCLMPRGGGTPSWEGQAVRGTLATFSDIAAASLAHGDNVAVWAANTGVGAGCLIVRDQRTGDWSVDQIPGSLEVRGLAQQDGKLVYITSTGCRRQTDEYDDGDGQLIPLLAETGDTTAFGVAGWGKIACLTLLVEARDSCKVRGSISYDGGLNFSLVKEYELDTSSGLPVELQFWPRRRKCARFRWRFEVVNLSGATEGVILNGMTLHVRPSGGPTKTASDRRG